MKTQKVLATALIFQGLILFVIALVMYNGKYAQFGNAFAAFFGILIIILLIYVEGVYAKALRNVRVKKVGNPVWIETMIEEKKNEITAELAIVDLLEKRINKLHTERNLIWLFREKDAVRARELSISVLQQIAMEAQDNAYHLGILQHYYEDLLERSNEYIEKNERETD